MNHDTNTGALPELTSDFLRSSHNLIDNIFADLWKQIGMCGRRSEHVGIWPV